MHTLSEVREAIQGFLHFHTSRHAHRLLNDLLQQVIIQWYRLPGDDAPLPDDNSSSRIAAYLDDPAQCTFTAFEVSPRKSPRMLYILHLFSGVKRQHDFHSYIDALSSRFSGIFCPISVDIALRSIHGDLLRHKTQTFWLQCAAAGMIFFILCGPPCETWSAARFRFITDGCGPRPVREVSPPHLLRGKANLTLKELKQVAFANRLLQFALQMMVRQLSAGNFGILEHPALAEPRDNIQPPSIWLLPCMTILLSHPLKFFQGHYHAVSPKPTTFLCVADPLHADLMMEALTGSRTRRSLPPPLSMGKTASGVFATTQKIPWTCVPLWRVWLEYAIAMIVWLPWLWMMTTVSTP